MPLDSALYLYLLYRMKRLKLKNKIIAVGLILILSACAATRDLAPTIDKNFKADTAKLTFYTPNFSAIHMPPLLNSYAYIDTYGFSDFCSDGVKPVSKSSVNNENKLQESLLPTGKIVAHIGYNATGAGGLTGESFYVMNIKSGEHYKITLTEARPLVTSYSVEIDMMDGDKALPVEVLNFDRKKDVCK